MAFVPEAPEIGGLGALTIEFLLLCFAVVVFGLIRGSSLLVWAIQFVVENSIGKLPVLGWIVHKITDPVFAAVERGLSDAALGVQGAIGYYWHALGTLVHWLGREIRAQADLIAELAHYALPSTWAHLAAQEFARLHHTIYVVERAGVRTIERLHTVERTTVARAQAAVLPRVHGLEDLIGHVVMPDIAGLRARARELTDRWDALYKQIRKFDALLGTAGLTAAVAVALARLDVSWIRCRNWNRIGKGICGLPAELLDALALGVIDAFIVSDLCAFAAIIGAEAEAIRPVLYGLVDVEEALIGCHGATAPPPLKLPALRLPPVTGGLALTA